MATPDIPISARALDLFEWLLTPSLPVFVLALAVVLFVPVLLHAYLARQTAYVTLPSVIVAGPSGAGKTALVAYLERAGAASAATTSTEKTTTESTTERTTTPTTTTGPPLTHTSQTPNVVELAVAADGRSSFRDDLDAAGAVAKKFLLVDTPGHGKLRGPTLRWLGATGTKKAAAAVAARDDAVAVAAAAAGPVKAVVFMVDAAALAKDADDQSSNDSGGLADTAAYLYDVLLALQQRMADGTRSARPPPALPVLVAANKADLFTALPAARVRARLEAELQRVRASRSHGLLDSGTGADGDDDGGLASGADDSAHWLGAYGSTAFSFDELREFDTEVAVVGGSLVAEPGVDQWWAWVAEQI